MNLIKNKLTNDNITMGKEEINQTKNLDKNLRDLLELTDNYWGHYQFKKDPIGHMFSEDERNYLIEKCLDEVDLLIKELMEEYSILDPRILTEKLELKVFRPEKPAGLTNITYAIFEEPNNIYIYQDTINKYNSFMSGNSNIKKIFDGINLEKVILAHEIFHAIELKKKNSIFTQTFKKRLWKIGPLKNDSRVIALSEFSAKIFSKKLLGIEISPYIFEYLLVYLYDEEIANKIYLEMIDS